MMVAVRYVATLPPRADFVVIGGGIIGAATAFFAARAGLRPLLIERRPALSSLTTAVATGGYRLQFDTPEELHLVRRSVALLAQFTDLTGQSGHHPHLRPQGYLWATTEAAMAVRQRALVAAQREWGLDDVELLAGDEARRRFPYLGEHVVQARFRAGDGFLDPQETARGFAASAAAPVVVGCAVTGFRVVGGKLVAVETTQGTVETSGAVIAGGPFSGMLARQAGVALPLTAVRRQKVILPDVSEVPPDAPMTIDEETGTHWRPAFGGAYLLRAEPEAPTLPTEHVPADAAFAVRLLDPDSAAAAARITPFWRTVWTRDAAWSVVAGQYTMTPDHRPLIGETAVTGLWVNTGYSGHGVMASAAGGELLAALLAGEHPPEAATFRPDRTFAGHDDRRAL